MMKVFFVQECPTCGRSLEIGVAHLGRDVYCRHCHAKFTARPSDAPVGDTDGKLTPRVDLMAGSGEAADVMLAEAELTSKLKGKLASFRTTLKGKDLEIFDLRLAAQDEPLNLEPVHHK